jgi:pilus assembly protein TadC
MNPFVPFPKSVMKTLGRPFLGLGEVAQKFFPHYNLVLEQTNMDLNADEFFSMTLAFTFINFALFALIFGTLLYALDIEQYVEYGLGLAAVIGAMVFIRTIFGPRVIIQKRIRSIDSHLIYGLKMIIVEINAGLSLFDAVVIVAMHDVGEMGNIFKEIAKRMASGENDQDVLKDIATRNPSHFLRKVLWQIVSGLKAGSSLKDVMSESLSALERQQRTDIIAYGSSHRVLTLVFMMVGVIIPSMAIAFLSVLNFLPGITISSTVFWLLLAGIVVAQFMLIGFIKSRRPNLMGSV